MVSRLISSNPRFMKMMQREDEPIPISGPKLLPTDRQVIWKKVCIIGELCRECIVEMSHTKTKFYIVSLDLEYNHYSTIEMFRPQATKLIKACASINDPETLEQSALHRLMTYLDYKFGQLCIKDKELLMQYQLYMSPYMIKQANQQQMDTLTKKESKFLKIKKKKKRNQSSKIRLEIQGERGRNEGVFKSIQAERGNLHQMIDHQR